MIMFCKNCGAELTEGLDLCMNCGAAVNDVASDAIPVPKKVEKKDALNVGMFVWSLINTILCCQPAGIIALIFTLLARYEEKVKADKYIGIAKICNIIGTVIGVLAVIAIIFYVVVMVFLFGILAGGGAMYY